MDDQTPMNYDEEPNGKDQSSSPHSPCKSIHTELKSENKCLLDAKGIHETLDIHQGGGAKESKYYNASVLYLTLHNISIESDGKLQLPAHYAKYHTSETSLKPQSNGPNLVHKQQNSLGSNEKSSDTSDDALSCNILECDDYDDKKETVQHNHKSDSSSPENDKNMKTVSCLKGLDGISANNIAFYAHLAKRELQIIRNSDLEYTKELGHGTYGTVLHRKWKGSDVAIKRMKCTCSSKDEQLVADFWKEAHTLSQLNHPNIVALYGVVTDGPINCLATVTEYVVNGSLKQVLHRKDRTIDHRKRMILAMDAAFAWNICMERTYFTLT